MRYAIVYKPDHELAGQVIRRGDCPPVDFENQVTAPWEAVVWIPLELGVIDHTYTWDFDTLSFSQST